METLALDLENTLDRADDTFFIISDPCLEVLGLSASVNKPREKSGHLLNFLIKAVRLGVDDLGFRKKHLYNNF